MRLVKLLWRTTKHENSKRNKTHAFTHFFVASPTGATGRTKCGKYTYVRLELTSYGDALCKVCAKHDPINNKGTTK